MSKSLPWVTFALLSACTHSMPMPSPGPSSPRHASPEQAVQAYFRASDEGSGRQLRSAFHPDALMHWADGGDGALRTLTQLEWWQRLDDRTQAPAPASERHQTMLDREGSFALLEATSRWPSHTFVDLMLAMETPSGWRIVGKVFHKLAPGEELPRFPSAEQEIRAVLEGKIRAHALYSPALLLQTHTADCRYYRAHVEGERFAWESLSVGAAIYAALEDAGERDPDSPWNILKVEVRGSVAAAKLEVLFRGVRYIDHLLLVRTGGQWRISSAAWGDPRPSP
ncbi:nuclear transport factor 2 family protein [Myxococcus stipitatus]|uniref:nuclear transport factor 2 family protein n=1 Tax=Myxococcus stipitatus TaxID=83455 RepID=UPI00314526F2